MRSPFEDLYRANFARAVELATRNFHVPRDAARILAQEVFLSYLRRADSTGDFDAWLVAAIAQASECWWRRVHAMQRRAARYR